MAPVPDEEFHYGGASPLDGGTNPASLGGSGGKFSPTGLEIGLIVGVVALVIVSLIWLFFWRSRRNRMNKQPRSPSSAAAEGNGEELTDASGLRIPIPLPKDDRASTADNDEVSSIERPPRSHRRPMVNWSHRPQSPHLNRENHEMPTRV
ncbi:hypothetical protein HD806DRAFT_531578 [Xylariaceae sp. AK1471]|nr:hypothetical protein HD806DRAFT_531578 [Xylariaceae sp. AK1471]